MDNTGLNSDHPVELIPCHVLMNANTPKDSVYKLDSDGEYHWGYNNQDYKKFSITDDFIYDVDESYRAERAEV